MVMNVEIMYMTMSQGLVRVLVDMRLLTIPAEGMLMPMVLIVLMTVGVSERLVRVVVLVLFGEV